MRNEYSGVNLIIADSHEEAGAICNILGVSEPSLFKSFETMYLVDPEAVFVVVLTHKHQMQQFANCFKLKRCVISHGGEREVSGFNVDWIKKILGHKTAKPHEYTRADIPILAMLAEEEKSDPHAEIGYRR